MVVIKHWKIHNYIRNDRFKPTVYTEEKALLVSKGNGAYTEKGELDTDGIPSDNQVVYQMDTQDRIGKFSLGEVKEKVNKKNRKALYFSLFTKIYEHAKSQRNGCIFSFAFTQNFLNFKFFKF